MTESSRVQSEALSLSLCSSLTLAGPARHWVEVKTMNLEPEKTRTWDPGSVSANLRFLIWDVGILMGFHQSITEENQVGVCSGRKGYMALMSNILDCYL